MSGNQLIYQKDKKTFIVFGLGVLDLKTIFNL